MPALRKPKNANELLGQAESLIRQIVDMGDLDQTLYDHLCDWMDHAEEIEQTPMRLSSRIAARFRRSRS